MILIEEKQSIKLPNITSLFFKLPFLNKIIDEQLTQLPIMHFDKKSLVYEIPITKLFFVINLLVKYDSIKFKPYQEKSKEILNCSRYKFKVKPYKYQLDGIEFGLNHDGWLLLDDQGLGKTLQMIYLAEVLKKKENLKHCLIVCGVNGLKYN